ncbi:MAG: hypothetical protein HWN69_00090, partial [Desulfobacterales bacterium]|nr:hypothetical protein [Desulfobacterales bacterium]
MTKDQIDENNSKETPEVEGRTEAEPETGEEDVKTEVPSAASTADVAGVAGTGEEGEDIGESSEPADADD